MEVKTTEENLNEISWLSPVELEARIIGGAVPVCGDCIPAMRDRARDLTGFTGIGRLSMSKAIELLDAYNQAACTHLGGIAIAAIPASELANV